MTHHYDSSLSMDRRLSDSASTDGAPDTPPPIPTESPEFSDEEQQQQQVEDESRAGGSSPSSTSSPSLQGQGQRQGGPVQAVAAETPASAPADMSFRDLPSDVAFNDTSGLEIEAGGAGAGDAAAAVSDVGAPDSTRVQQASLLRQFNISAASDMVDILHNEGMYQ